MQTLLTITDHILNMFNKNIYNIRKFVCNIVENDLASLLGLTI